MTFAGTIKPEELFKLEIELRANRIQLLATIAQIAGGTVLLIGIYFTAQSLTVSREGEITERFTRAIDQIGAAKALPPITDSNMVVGNADPVKSKLIRSEAEEPNIDVRLGGIYALARIAKESPDDRQAITEILTAYVRNNAQMTSHGTARPAQPAQQRTDIQAILTIIGQRRYGGDIGAIDLSRSDLEGYDFQRFDLRAVNLSGTDLSGARLNDANLTHANFEGSYLNNADLSESDLTEANLIDAHLNNALMMQAILINANLQGADVSGAALDGTDLYSTFLEGAKFDNTGLRGANLTFANLNGADLSNSFGLTQIQIDRACDFNETKLPKGIIPPVREKGDWVSHPPAEYPENCLLE
jgi:uncharacterized protein YjbI with pentapeptide repeats